MKNIRTLVSDRPIWLWAFFCLSSVFLASFLIWVFLNALDHGTNMGTYATNGTFQLYNPLRRLQLGQTIGLDFPFFHGVGVPFLHYPIFIMLGGGVFAAETAKWLVSPVLFVLSSLVFFYAYFRCIKKSVIATSIAVVSSLFWLDVIWPRQSLMEIRGTLPILVAAALMGKTSRSLRISRVNIPINELIALSLLGLSIPFGTEQGIAAILAYALIQFVRILKDKKRLPVKDILNLATKGVIILLVAFISITLFTKGNPIAAIKYAVFDIPQDQAWYFGTDVTGYLSWSNFLPNLFNIAMLRMWTIIVLGIFSLWILVKYEVRDTQKSTLAYLFVYGLIAFIISLGGYYLPSNQSVPLQRVMLLLPILLLVVLLFDRRRLTMNMSKITPRYVEYFIVALVIATPAYLLMKSTINNIHTIAGYNVRDELRLAKKARHENDYFSSSIGWKESIDTFRPHIKPGLTIWSTYTSVYDTTFGNQINSSRGGEDYIIHALGDKRRADYESDFFKTKPHYVITLKPSYSDFEEWLWDSHWRLYEEIFKGYSIVSENSSHYLWEIKPDSPRQALPVVKAVTTRDSITLPSNQTKDPVLYTVNINYDVSVAIPLTSKMSRYFIDINTSHKAQRYHVSLPGHKTTWSFPVVVMPGEDTVKLKAFTDGVAPMANLRVTSATYQEITVDKDNLKPFENNFCFIKSKQIPSESDPLNCDFLRYTILVD